MFNNVSLDLSKPSVILLNKKILIALESSSIFARASRFPPRLYFIGKAITLGKKVKKFMQLSKISFRYDICT